MKGVPTGTFLSLHLITPLRRAYTMHSHVAIRRRRRGSSAVRRIVFSAFFAAFAILATATITPAFAHDGGFAAASDGDKDRDKDARSEAAQLTDEIKAAG